MLIAVSHSASLLRVVDANVDDSSIDAIKSVCRACPNLRILNLMNISDILPGDEVIQTIAQYCPQIEKLSTEYETMTDAGLDALASIHMLSHLDIYTYRSTSATVQRVLRSNPLLTLLIIYIAGVDDALVRCIGNYCGNLNKLKLYPSSSPTLLSYSCLLELFKGCPLLESFALYQRNGVSTAALRAMFEHCPHLTELVLC